MLCHFPNFSWNQHLFLFTGFIMMTPQLFINYKLKSVAHLPWRMMTYKALNTFIDDIFAFVIKMPTMYRLGCFRDDIVFFIFLYQKYMYRVSIFFHEMYLEFFFVKTRPKIWFLPFFRSIIQEWMNMGSQEIWLMKLRKRN